MRAFTGEKFDLQLDFVIIDRYKDAVDIFLHKIAVDESVHRIVAGGLQHAADLRDVCVEVGAGVLLLLKLGETAAALLDLLVALAVHFEKVRVRDLTGDIVLEQLALFLFGKVAPGALHVDLLRKTGVVLTERTVHGNIAFDEFIGVDIGLLEYVHQNRLELLLVQRQGRAGVLAVFDLAGADPLAVFVALPVYGIAAVVGRAAVGAEQLAGQQVGVVAKALSVLNVLAAAA